MFGVFLKMELCWSPKRGLRSVFSLKFRGQRKPSPDESPHLLAVFFLGLGEQKTGDALGVGAGREGQIDRGFMRWQNT